MKPWTLTTIVWLAGSVLGVFAVEAAAAIAQFKASPSDPHWPWVYGTVLVLTLGWVAGMVLVSARHEKRFRVLHWAGGIASFLALDLLVHGLYAMKILGPA